jgi:hypothetical protein
MPGVGDDVVSHGPARFQNENQINCLAATLMVPRDESNRTGPDRLFFSAPSETGGSATCQLKMH